MKISIEMGFCQEENLGVEHLRIGIDIISVCGILYIESQGARL